MMPSQPPRRRLAEYCGLICWIAGWLGLVATVTSLALYPLTDRGFEHRERLLIIAGASFLAHLIFLPLSQILRTLIDLEQGRTRNGP
jgi:hypothetical protein